MIYLLDETSILEEKYEGRLFKMFEEFAGGDILLFESKKPSFYEVDQKGNEARLSLTLAADLQEAEFKIFQEFFRFHKEVEDPSITLDKFPRYTKEKLEESFCIAVDRVKKHQHLDDKQESILLALFIKGETKKDLVMGGMCTYEEIEQAVRQLNHELPYCYGFVNDGVLHLAEQHSSGALELSWSIEYFCKNNHLLPTMLETLICRGSRYSDLSEAEKNQFEALFAKLSRGETLLTEEKSELATLVNRIQDFYFACRDNTYIRFGEELKAKAIMGSRQIKQYAKEYGLHPGRLLRAAEDAFDAFVDELE